MSDDYLSKYLGENIDEGVAKAVSALQPGDIVNDYTTDSSILPVSAGIIKTLFDNYISKAATKETPSFTGNASFPSGALSNLGIRFATSLTDGWYHTPANHGIFQVVNGKVVMGCDVDSIYMAHDGQKGIEVLSDRVKLHKNLDLTGVDYIGDIPDTFKEKAVERDVFASSTNVSQSLTIGVDSNGASNGMKCIVYCKTGDNVHACEVLVIRIDGVTSTFNQYNVMQTGSDLFTLSSTATNTDITLSLTPILASTVTMKILGKL